MQTRATDRSTAELNVTPMIGILPVPIIWFMQAINAPKNLRVQLPRPGAPPANEHTTLTPTDELARGYAVSQR